MSVEATELLVLLPIGIVLTFVVGRVLVASGESMLADGSREPEGARSSAQLVVVLFHLVVIGLLALVSIIAFPTEGMTETIVAKAGVMLLIMAAGCGVALALLSRIREQRRSEEFSEDVTREIQRAEHGLPPAASTSSAPPTGGPVPAIDPSAGPAVEYPQQPDRIGPFGQ